MFNWILWSLEPDLFFRQDVLKHLAHKNYGEVFCNIPYRYTAITIVLSIVIGLSLTLLFCMEFTEQVTVIGYLTPKTGLMKIYPKKAGFILTSNAFTGKHIQQGELLYKIDTAYDGFNNASKMAEINLIKTRISAISKEIRYKQAQMRQLDALRFKKYISLRPLQAKRSEIMLLESQQHQLKIALIKQTQANQYLIRAPLDGVISVINYQPGQYVLPTKPLVTILPNNAHLIAELLIPVKKSGYLRIGDPVLIHYDAWPYQKFGTAKAIIQSISQSTLTDADEEKTILIKEPYYKVIATLDTQYINLNGKIQPLTSGMTFSAILFGARKKVWQWIFNPLQNQMASALI